MSIETLNKGLLTAMPLCGLPIWEANAARTVCLERVVRVPALWVAWHFPCSP